MPRPLRYILRSMAEGVRGGASRLGVIALLGACIAGLGGVVSAAQSEEIPWTGSPGIAETVAAIMKRPEQIGMGASSGNAEFRDGRLRQNRMTLPQNPMAQPAAGTTSPAISGPFTP